VVTMFFFVYCATLFPIFILFIKKKIYLSLEFS